MGTVFGGDFQSPQVGIIPRALRDIFLKINELTESSVTATCSFLELYQENLYDLLSGKSKEQSVCEIREDSTKGIIINGLTEMSIIGKLAFLQSQYTKLFIFLLNCRRIECG